MGERFIRNKKEKDTTFVVSFLRGAGNRSRTGTLSPAADFESATSTNSIIPADANLIIHDKRENGKGYGKKIQVRTGKKGGGPCGNYAQSMVI